MTIRTLLFPIALFCFSLLHGQQAGKALTKGLTIARTTKIKTGTYRFDAPDSLNRPVILIEGDSIVVDFSHAILKGSNSRKNPDEFFGTGIMIRNSRKVTIRNLKVRGYKVALLARNVSQLVLESCDFSYNYRQHLNSTQEKEDISDWMSYHHNEKDEWLRYGAAIYLRGCDGATIRNCIVTGGQNALMMTACNDGKIYNNDFSFNSGIGIGLYRSSRNEICYNKLDFNVRGYSHGVYNRGQDSAGILVYEQSNKNIFYKNSATHSGDGFFLWAGQTTMDTGKGGCNDNIIAENDFSYAPTNGVEVTFSRNRVSGNRIFECDYGIWGGYSYGSKFTENKFRNNRTAIAIEHGQHNEISYNVFYGDKDAIRLWARRQQPADWGYAKYRDTRSAGYEIAMNSFNNHRGGVIANSTDSIHVYGNTTSGIDTLLQLDSTVTHIDSTEGYLSDDNALVAALIYPIVEKPIDPFAGNTKLAGRKNILVTEWGPYDFRSPIIWNTNPVDTGDIMYFDLIGPKGKWIIKKVRGVDSISAKEGEFPSTITAKKIKGAAATDILIELSYTGAAITTPFGDRIAAGKPYTFSFKKYFQPIDWEVDWFSFDSMSNVITHPEYLGQLDRRPPIMHEAANKLDYAWWGGINSNGSNYKQFFTIASGVAEVPGGTYELSVTWDDAVRVYVDGKRVLDEWNPSKYTFDESPNRKIRLTLGGHHSFRVEHAELGGFATLAVRLKKL